MKVNSFPSLTWDFLKINNSDLNIIEGNQIEPTISLPTNVFVDKQFSEEFFNSVQTGMGSEFDIVFNSLKLNARCFYVEEDKNVETICIEYKATDENCFDEVLIHASKNSKSNFIFVFKSIPNFDDVLGARIRVVTEENAFVHIGLVNLCGKNAKNFVSFGSKIADNAIVETTEIILGGKENIWGNYNLLEGYKSKFNGHNAYLVCDKEVLDVNYVSLHKGGETNSSMAVDGVIDGTGKKTWRGTIDFKKGCAESKGDEQENVLLLDPKVENKSLPVILCDEESVEGRHGASIGRLGKEILFYMQSRGVDEKTAQNLMIRAKINTAARCLGNEKIATEVLNFIEKEE